MRVDRGIVVAYIPFLEKKKENKREYREKLSTLSTFWVF